MKTCTKCGIDKPLTEFYKQPNTPDKLQYHCKTCEKIRAKIYRETNKNRKYWPVRMQQLWLKKLNECTQDTPKNTKLETQLVMQYETEN